MEVSLQDYFIKPADVEAKKSGYYVATKREALESFAEYTLMGRIEQTHEDAPPMRSDDADDTSTSSCDRAAGCSTGDDLMYLNTYEPFCFVTCGVQGSGKSHTVGCMLEGCMLDFPENDVTRLRAPMTALVLHYDQNVTSVCEVTGLITAHPELKRILGIKRSVPRQRMTVLVSPTYYKQRRAFYGNYCEVKPLLFRWSSLTADHIKRIMRIQDTDNQLYVAVMLTVLRQYQRAGVIPDFNEFMSELKAVCSKLQNGPLTQRFALLESLILESDVNKGLVMDGADLLQCCVPGQLVVVDLTDPMLSKDEANGIFQVLTEQFRAMPVTKTAGKLLVLDEAHKFMDGHSGDGLSQSIVNVARLMRHDGMRLIVSTQSPRALAPELLELVTTAVLHRFHSRDWLTYLNQKLNLPDEIMPILSNLAPGSALVFASRHLARQASVNNCFKVAIRARVTADRGSSKTNEKQGSSA